MSCGPQVGLYIYNIACADMLAIGTSTPELADRDDGRVANFKCSCRPIGGTGRRISFVRDRSH